MQKMSPDEILAFLSAGTRTGKLATVRADGRPHLVPIWFTLDGDDLIFMTWHTSVKAKNMQRDGRVAICVDEQAPPYSYVFIEGTIEVLNPTPDELLDWSTRIARRYMGDDLADQFGKRNAVEGELLIRVTPTKIVAHKNVSD